MHCGEASPSTFPVACYVDSYPRRSELFILRELTALGRRWPRLRVYCRRELPAEWRYVDSADGLSTILWAELEADPIGRLTHHAAWGVRHPLRYLQALACSVAMDRFPRPRCLLRLDRALRLARLARADGVTHLHAHFAGEPAAVTCLAARLLSCTYTISAHAHDIWAERPAPHVLEGAACVVACTEAGFAALRSRHPRAKVGLVRHGISSTESANHRPPPPPLRLLAAGRLVPKKGLDLLIEACARLAGEGIEFSCEIQGDGPQQGQLSALIARHRLQDRVTLGPFLPHALLRRRLMAAHLFVAPGRVDPATGDRDGVPNTILEAMAEGAIVVATSLPATREAITDGENGLLAAPDDADALARRIRDALDGQPDWPRMRRAARQTLANRFDLAIQAAKLADVIERATARN